MPSFLETRRIETRWLARGALLAGLALAVTGCVVEPPNPYPPVPARRAEVIPPAPASMVWQPGHYQWNGGDYIWIPGRYITRRGGHWERGHWRRAGGGWAWVPAHWQ